MENLHTKSKISIKNILSEIRTGEKIKRRHYIITIYTNDPAKSMMFLDLRLFNLFYKKNKSSIKELSEKMLTNEAEIKKSLKRISLWNKLFDQKYFKKVTIN